MHRWSTVTYKTFCGGMESEYPTWQLILPREALKHPFLLQGLFAAAALEMAATEEDQDQAYYVNQALEYQVTSLDSFRRTLGHLTPDNEVALFAFSVITMVLGLALPQYTKFRDKPESMVQGMITHFGLTEGVGLVTKRSGASQQPILRNHKMLAELPRAPIKQTDQSAIEGLYEFNETRHKTGPEQSLDSKLDTITLHTTCRKAILLLEEFWAKCQQHPNYYGHMLAWLNLTGKDFVTAIEHGDPVALLALMYWGVLAKRCGQGIWWGHSIGENLIEEITVLLGRETDATLLTGVRWARTDVGLS